MAQSMLEQVTQMAEQLSAEEKRILVERLSRQLRPSSQGVPADALGATSARQPRSLRGIWRGQFPEDLDVDAILHEIRHEWESELDEVIEE